MVVDLFRKPYRVGGIKARKGGVKLSITDFILLQGDYVVKHKNCGVEIQDNMGRFYVEQGYYIYKGGTIRLHQEVVIKYL